MAQDTCIMEFIVDGSYDLVVLGISEGAYIKELMYIFRCYYPQKRDGYLEIS
jgi:hypothetical protein